MKLEWFVDRQQHGHLIRLRPFCRRGLQRRTDLLVSRLPKSGEDLLSGDANHPARADLFEAAGQFIPPFLGPLTFVALQRPNQESGQLGSLRCG